MANDNGTDASGDQRRGLDPMQLRGALGRFATGVAVVTTVGPEGPLGLTVNSFTSVSLDPPLVLWCLERGSSDLPHWEACSDFSLSVLAADQKGLAERFAALVGDRFSGVGIHRGHGSAPRIDGAVAWIDCHRHAVMEGGDHSILVGRVTALDSRGGDPLLFLDGRFVTAGTPL